MDDCNELDESLEIASKTWSRITETANTVTIKFNSHKI